MDQIDLVALDGPARYIRGTVRDELVRRREGLDAAQQVRLHADRCTDELIVEEMLEAAGRGLPAHVLDAAGLRAAVVVLVGFGRVVGIAGLGGPPRCDLGVACPVRQGEAPGGVGQPPWVYPARGGTH